MACSASSQISDALCAGVGRPAPGTGLRAGYRAGRASAPKRGVSVKQAIGPRGNGLRSTTMGGPRGAVTKVRGM